MKEFSPSAGCSVLLSISSWSGILDKRSSTSSSVGWDSSSTSGIEQPIQFLFGEEPFFLRHLADGLSLVIGSFGDPGCFVIAHPGCQGCGKGETLFNHLFTPLPISLQPFDTSSGKIADGIGKEMNRLNEIVGDQRHHHVEFEIAAQPAQGNGCVVSDHLSAYLDRGIQG